MKSNDVIAALMNRQTLAAASGIKRNARLMRELLKLTLTLITFARAARAQTVRAASPSVLLREGPAPPYPLPACVPYLYNVH